MHTTWQYNLFAFQYNLLHESLLAPTLVQAYLLGPSEYLVISQLISKPDLPFEILQHPAKLGEYAWPHYTKALDTLMPPNY